MGEAGTLVAEFQQRQQPQTRPTRLKGEQDMKTILLLVLAAACIVGTAHGQTGPGAKYGARDPFVCK